MSICNTCLNRCKQHIAAYSCERYEWDKRERPATIYTDNTAVIINAHKTQQELIEQVEMLKGLLKEIMEGKCMNDFGCDTCEENNATCSMKLKIIDAIKII